MNASNELREKMWELCYDLLPDDERSVLSWCVAAFALYLSASHSRFGAPAVKSRRTRPS